MKLFRVMLRSGIITMLRYDIVFFTIVTFENGRCKDPLSIVFYLQCNRALLILYFSFFMPKILIATVSDVTAQTSNELRFEVE